MGLPEPGSLRSDAQTTTLTPTSPSNFKSLKPFNGRHAQKDQIITRHFANQYMLVTLRISPQEIIKLCRGLPEEPTTIRGLRGLRGSRTITSPVRNPYRLWTMCGDLTFIISIDLHMLFHFYLAWLPVVGQRSYIINQKWPTYPHLGSQRCTLPMCSKSGRWI